MDGNGEAAAHFQLNVGGLLYRFPGSVVEVEYSEFHAKRSETVVSPLPSKLFNWSLPIF